MKTTEEEAIPIEGHHREICRFYGTQDERFEAVWKAIRRLILREDNKRAASCSGYSPSSSGPSLTTLTAEQVNLLNSLPDPNIYEALETIEEPCPGTTDWILSNPQFTTWLISVEDHVLHVVGKPGSGKSVLAAFLFQSRIHQVLDHHPFYFAFTDRSDGRSAAAAWAALVHQLLLEDPSLFSEVFTQPNQSRRISPGLHAKLWTESWLKQVFERLLMKFRHPSIYIIDALDQCDETVEKFVASFAALAQGNAPAKVKLLVLSRHGPASSNLSARFPKLMSFDLDDQIQHDMGIRTAIKQKVDELCRKRDCPQLADIITEKLSLTAKGMYLLPMMAVNSLMKVHATPRNIMKELHRFPEDVMVAYRQALDNIEKDDRQLAASLLLWVVFTTRPLSIRELSSLVALDDTVGTGQDLEMNTSVDLLNTAGVVELLGPILKVSKSEGSSFVSLIHHSTREFLLRFDRTADSSCRSCPPRWIFEVFDGSNQPPETLKELWNRANRNLANCCFRYYYLTIRPNDRTDGKKTPENDLDAHFNPSDPEDQRTKFEGEPFGIFPTVEFKSLTLYPSYTCLHPLLCRSTYRYRNDLFGVAGDFLDSPS